jgi:flagellar basal-body rod protein FlgB
MPTINQSDPTLQLLEKVLDLRIKNQQVISSNIANADTPGYSAVSLEFEDQLRRAMDAKELTTPPAHPAHIPIAPLTLDQVEGQIHRQRDRTGLGDENSVSVDQEMVKLSENQIMYEAAITMLSKKLATLKYAANDGA